MQRVLILFQAIRLGLNGQYLVVTQYYVIATLGEKKNDIYKFSTEELKSKYERIKVDKMSNVRLLPSMMNKTHGWTKINDDDYKVIRELISLFLIDDEVKIINFDEVSKEYLINVSTSIIYKCLEKMGFKIEFDGENGWQYDCWYKCTMGQTILTLYATCFSNNISLEKGWVG